MKHKKPTRGVKLRRQLEEEIFSGHLEPGVRLDENALAQRFEVSRTPVREALRQLASCGLVEMRPHQGAVVATITLPSMIEMFEVMAELEGLCARLAARRMTDHERSNLVEIHEQCQQLAENGDIEAYYTCNKIFHEAIYAGSHNQFLEESTCAIRNRLSPYRRQQLNQSGRLSHSFKEHDKVVKAILDLDDEAAAQALSKHINIQGNVFTDFISTLPKSAFNQERRAV
ncbi:MAG: GntR family transcriptional regulator [Rhodospirillales bacterium]|nr:GntR family transcriptional regulator [Rhodospirillales bacterium]